MKGPGPSSAISPARLGRNNRRMSRDGKKTGSGWSGRSRSPWAQGNDDDEIPHKHHPDRLRRTEAQINIRGDARTLDRFKRLCRDDRRTYIDMLRILLDAFEKDGSRERTSR